MALLTFGTYVLPYVIWSVITASYDIVAFITFATYTVNAFNVVMSLLHIKFPNLVFDMCMIFTSCTYHVHTPYHVHVHITYIMKLPLWLRG